MPRDQSYYGQQRTLPFRNDAREAVPAFAVMEIVGTLSDGTVLVQKPAADFQPEMLIINGPLSVPADKQGECTLDMPAYGRFDVTWTPQNGEFGTAKAGSWDLVKAGKTNARFSIIGGTVGGRVLLGPFRCCTTSSTSSSTPSTGTTTSTSTSTTPEPGCAGAKCWQFTIAGVINGDCSNCSNHNRTVIVQEENEKIHESCFECNAEEVRFGACCLWSTPYLADWNDFGGGICQTDFTHYWALAFDEGQFDLWTLTLWAFGFDGTCNFTRIIRYQILADDFDPSGPNTLSQFGDARPSCGGWPTEVIIEPVSCL